MNYLSVLKNHKLKATPQRLAVLDILDERTHPTMDELYEKIKNLHPSVSLATVYKNVNTLKDNGLIVEVNIPNGKTRYDVFLEPHLHVVCKTCNHIQDISYDKNLAHYQEYLEKNIKNSISSLDVVAYVDRCAHCLSFKS